MTHKLLSSKIWWRQKRWRHKPELVCISKCQPEPTLAVKELSAYLIKHFPNVMLNLQRRPLQQDQGGLAQERQHADEYHHTDKQGADGVGYEPAELLD